MTEEQIYQKNLGMLKTKDCYIFKKKNTYYLHYYGVDEKLPKDSWMGILQINAYNLNFDPTWLLEDGEQAGNAMLREMLFKLQNKIK
jgi:hypothetical protein